MAKVGTDTGPDQENQKRQDDNCPKSNPQSSKARQGDADRGKEEVDKDEQSGDGVCWGALVHFRHEGSHQKNIARGTTDPEIASETWTKLGNNMAPLALIANLATRWRHLQ